ncbi:hypothetical protein GCM10027275_50400 [Rhabdobacter roseus]|uniref:DUF5977 domain-containing protein n=1 Tax=Rhabdobacter roseus TaxID=1655419 RepID=A0A840U0L8_9BACT|nr:hypothetical protein [Rhabdobacter roseus]MBB5287113.1 hypothetical protein [Rhabdobacter roseus]
MIDDLALNLAYLPLQLSRNKLTHTIEAADPALTSRAGLKYFLTLLVPDFPFSSTFEELHTSEGRETPVDVQGGLQRFAGAVFRYNRGRGGKLDGLLTYAKPRRQQNVLSLSLSQTMAFCLREGIQGGEPAVDVENTLPKRYVIKAGLANEDFVAYGDTFFTSWQSGARQFLTWQPNYKRVAYAQEEYLYFLLNFSPAPQQLRLRVQWYQADGTASGASTVLTLDNPLLMSVVACPVGASVLALPTEAARYDVWLSNEANKRLSEVRSYWLDDTHTPYDRSILFVNSLGGWDTLRLTGQGQRTLTVAQQVADVERPAGAGVDFSELLVVQTEGEYTLQVSTGYFRSDAAAYLRYLDELLLSEEMYLITDKGHRPLQLLTNSVVDAIDDADLVARTFSFRILDTVENYSDLPPTEPAPLRPMAWRGVNLGHVLDAFGKRTGKLVFQRLERIYADDNSLVKPYTVKPNVQGDPDYVPPITDSSIEPGSTPYPSAAISRAGTFLRATCASGYLGGPATIVIAAGRYGAETEGTADERAEAEYASRNTQATADASGSCTLNNTPVHLAIHHQIPMNVHVVIANGLYGPVVSLRVNDTELVGNSTGQSPPIVNRSVATLMPGTYNILARVQYNNTPRHPCRLRLVGKNREITVTTDGFYLFENVVVNSADSPLTVEVLNL